MSEKSHVSLEQNLCIVCCAPFETGSILIDKRLRQSLEHHTVTGYGMCPEHAKLRDDGFVALVACDPSRSKLNGKDVVKPSDVYRTGEIAHLRKRSFEAVINVPVPDNMVCFCDPEVIVALQKMVAPEPGTQPTTEG